MLANYFPICVFIAIGIALGLLPILAASLIGIKKPNPDKLSAYECGFPSFDTARLPFDVRFYLIAILFILFDLETAFFVPWAIVLRHIGWAGFFAMAVFLFLLLLGFLYEWKKGALEWE